MTYPGRSCAFVSLEQRLADFSLAVGGHVAVSARVMRRRNLVKHRHILDLSTHHGTYVLLVFVLRVFILFLFLLVGTVLRVLVRLLFCFWTRLLLANSRHRSVDCRARGWCVGAFRFIEFIRVVLVLRVAVLFEDLIDWLIAGGLVGLFPLVGCSVCAWIRRYGNSCTVRVGSKYIASVRN